MAKIKPVNVPTKYEAYLQSEQDGTKFDPSWLWKWYKRDKCEAKLNEEKELYKEA